MNRKVFTYKDLEEAKSYIGKKGIFSDSLEDINAGEGQGGILSLVSNVDYHFEKDDRRLFQFFSPDTEPVETWVPFTGEDHALFIGKLIRKKTWTNRQWTIIVSYLSGLFVMLTQTDTLRVSGRVLLDDYEFIDGTPCGKKVTQ